MTERRNAVFHGVGKALLAGNLLLGCAWVASGCESGSSRLTGGREISLADFARKDIVDDHDAELDAHKATASIEAPSERSPAMPVQLQATSPTQARAVPDDGGNASAVAPARRVVVDSLVGQVNGRPIFANEFFAPIEDQLRAIGRRTTQREFLTQARPIIMEHVRQIVLNELFLAEAESQLTQEQQQGILAWMRYIRDTTIAEGGGTRTGTGQQLQEREGMTIEQYVEARRDMALLQQLRREKIEPRVIVSWRDVQREYERRWDEFNPPATLSLARIRLSTESEAERIQQVQQRLEGGEAFADIADSLNQAGDGEIWQQFQMGAGGIADITLADHIKQHIIDLDVGQTSQPFEQGASTWWLHIAAIEQPQGRSLYDVQRQIYSSLRERRFNQEMNRYIESLFAKGVYDELDSMLLRLLEIGLVRYWGG